VRGRIAAIPQEPILFSGSVRSNVDPYDQHQDADIWLALERVNLKVLVHSEQPDMECGTLG
jgi:ABC-type multidrug transport system fused ATPase/permease subunit